MTNARTQPRAAVGNAEARAIELRLNSQDVLIYGRVERDAWERAEEYGMVRPLLITSPSVGAGKAVAGLAARTPPGVNLAVYRDVRPHAPVSQVLDAMDAYVAHEADGVIAIGGGSVTDTAKLVTLRAMTPDIWLRSLVIEAAAGRRDLLQLTDFEIGATVHCVAMPTTLSQAEYTQAAGFTSTDEGKAVFDHPAMRPSTVILDPILAGTTPQQIINSGLGKAIDSGISSLFSLRPADGILSSIVAGAVRVLWRGLDWSDEEKCHADNMSELQWAAWFAVAPRWISTTDPSRISARQESFSAWPGATLRHQLGGILGLPHAETACALLPSLIKGVETSDPLFSQRLGRTVEFEGRSLAEALIHRLEANGLPSHLSQLGVTSPDVERVAIAIEHETNGRWTRETATALLEAAI